MDHLDHSRQTPWLDPSKLEMIQVSLVGAGATGSAAAIALVKLGCRNLHVYDFDNVEDVNTGSQQYPLDSIGKPKVEALAELIKKSCGVEIFPHNERFELKPGQGRRCGQVLLMCVDNMATRIQTFEAIKGSMFPQLYVDTRISKEECMIYAISPCNVDHVKAYGAPEVLYPDAVADDAVCSMKFSVYTTAGICALWGVHQIGNWLNGNLVSNEVLVNLVSGITSRRQFGKNFNSIGAVQGVANPSSGVARRIVVK
jgi:molybdopterin/thiamine biosynthesis adenylyltransferase